MSHDPITINGKQWVYDAQTRTHRPVDQVAAKANDRPAGPAADMEPPARYAPAQAEQSLPFNTPVSITIISHRVRLCDPDNVSAKACIDGLVHCGILRDDSAKEVTEVRHRQVKVKNSSEEKTVIEIEATR